MIVLLLLALLAAVLGRQPRAYRKYAHNLTEMRRELTPMTDHKKRWHQIGIWLFALGTIFLGLLVVIIIL